MRMIISKIVQILTSLASVIESAPAKPKKSLKPLTTAQKHKFPPSNIPTIVVHPPSPVKEQHTPSSEPAITEEPPANPIENQPLVNFGVDLIEHLLDQILYGLANIAKSTDDFDVMENTKANIIDKIILKYTDASNLVSFFVTKRSSEFQDTILQNVFSDDKTYDLLSSKRFVHIQKESLGNLYLAFCYYNSILTKVLNHQSGDGTPGLIDFIDNAVSMFLISSDDVKRDYLNFHNEILAATADLSSFTMKGISERSTKTDFLELSFIMTEIQKIRFGMLSSLTRQNQVQISVFRSGKSAHLGISDDPEMNLKIKARGHGQIYRDIISNALQAISSYTRLLVINHEENLNSAKAQEYLHLSIQSLKKMVSGIIYMSAASDGKIYELIEILDDISAQATNSMKEPSRKIPRRTRSTSMPDLTNYESISSISSGHMPSSQMPSSQIPESATILTGPVLNTVKETPKPPEKFKKRKDGPNLTTSNELNLEINKTTATPKIPVRLRDDPAALLRKRLKAKRTLPEDKPVRLEESHESDVLTKKLDELLNGAFGRKSNEKLISPDSTSSLNDTTGTPVQPQRKNLEDLRRIGVEGWKQQTASEAKKQHEKRRKSLLPTSNLEEKTPARPTLISQNDTVLIDPSRNVSSTPVPKELAQTLEIPAGSTPSTAKQRKSRRSLFSVLDNTYATPILEKVRSITDETPSSAILDDQENLSSFNLTSITPLPRNLDMEKTPTAGVSKQQKKQVLPDLILDDSERSISPIPEHSEEEVEKSPIEHASEVKETVSPEISSTTETTSGGTGVIEETSTARSTTPVKTPSRSTTPVKTPSRSTTPVKTPSRSATPVKTPSRSTTGAVQTSERKSKIPIAQHSAKKNPVAPLRRASTSAVSEASSASKIPVLQRRLSETPMRRTPSRENIKMKSAESISKEQSGFKKQNEQTAKKLPANPLKTRKTTTAFDLGSYGTKPATSGTSRSSLQTSYSPNQIGIPPSVRGLRKSNTGIGKINLTGNNDSPTQAFKPKGGSRGPSGISADLNEAILVAGAPAKSKPNDLLNQRILDVELPAKSKREVEEGKSPASFKSLSSSLNTPVKFQPGWMSINKSDTSNDRKSLETKQNVEAKSPSLFNLNFSSIEPNVEASKSPAQSIEQPQLELHEGVLSKDSLAELKSTQERLESRKASITNLLENPIANAEINKKLSGIRKEISSIDRQLNLLRETNRKVQLHNRIKGLEDKIKHYDKFIEESNKIRSRQSDKISQAEIVLRERTSGEHARKELFVVEGQDISSIADTVIETIDKSTQLLNSQEVSLKSKQDATKKLQTAEVEYKKILEKEKELCDKFNKLEDTREYLRMLQKLNGRGQLELELEKTSSELDKINEALQVGRMASTVD